MDDDKKYKNSDCQGYFNMAGLNPKDALVFETGGQHGFVPQGNKFLANNKRKTLKLLVKFCSFLFSLCYLQEAVVDITFQTL